MSRDDKGAGGDVRELVETLRDLIVELRSIISDARNPFSPVMKEGGDDEELEPLSASPRIANPLTAPPPSSQGASSGAVDGGRGEEGRGDGVAEKEGRGPGGLESEGLFLGVARLIRTINVMQGFMDGDTLGKFIDALESLGYIDSRERRVAMRVVEAVESAKKYGLTPEEQLFLMYSLARAFGVRDPVIEDEVFNAVARMIGERKWGNQQ